ncbi:aminodeoxychorismate/anthranilate synthase component II [Sciscionella marina]|uniref:aminodeoxychorismate/anthranilate synthase component II n=1 Tax=Sciscionella marina TaxID=508770 RepID=UPI0003742AD1|nr:aminodeoxychorismate/anthranilate synthase component II [Sciscionella marina]
MRVLVVDNYDSFVYNLVQYLAQLRVRPEVWRNDAIGAEAAGQFDAVLLSPGPGTPERAGVCIDMVHACAESGTPLLGVCLGHQALGVAYGATVDRADELMHGKTSQVHHAGHGVLAGLPDPFTATRYHSLTVLPQTMPAEFEVTALTEGGVVMGMRHREAPLEGVQFHPESVLTDGGHRMLANWLRQAGFEVPAPLVDELEQDMRSLAQQAG